MAIKPIDYNLSFNKTVYESKEKQNDFNRLRDNNAYLQNHLNSEINRKKQRIQKSEEMEHKKVRADDKEERDRKQKGFNNDAEENPTRRNEKGDIKTNKTRGKAIRGEKGYKLDVFI